ncbi:MAG: putative sulfate exporter family transporter, partial [Bdellovibrionales bacterium]|nr:putative sulfate exporter family transporter [Bdellovibrionales bacterium]
MRQRLPGWVFIAILSMLASTTSGLIELGGKHPIEAAVIAIVSGMLLRQLQLIPQVAWPGVKAFEKPLILGIVLIGASLNFQTLASQGSAIFLVVLATMTIGLLVVYYLGRLFQLSNCLALLLAIGTTICGGTAIAICAPLLRAKETETSYAIATIALWGLVAILLYPYLGHTFGASELEFGIFAGTAIHSTPQVVGAGFIYSDLAGKTATAVKLVRNCFIAPVAVLAAFIGAQQTSLAGSQVTKQDILKAFPWFLFGYFILAGLNTANCLPGE